VGIWTSSLYFFSFFNLDILYPSWIFYYILKYYSKHHTSRSKSCIFSAKTFYG